MNIMPLPIVVSGAAGFIGSHLCRLLLQQGQHVVGIDDFRSSNKEAISALTAYPNFQFIEADIVNIDNLNVKASACIVHLASAKIPRYSSGWDVIEYNQKVNSAVLNYCIKTNTRLLFASTSDVYGKNPNPPFSELHDCVIGSPENKRWAYAVSKLFMEHALSAAGREFGLNYQIMRFFGCYGPGMAQGWWGGPQSLFIEQALKKEAFTIHGDGLQTRSYIYINDLVNAISLLLEKSELPSQVWNICAKPDSSIGVLDLARLIYKMVNGEGEAQFHFIPYESFGKYEDVRHRSGLNDKALSLLGWQPHIELHEGLIETIAQMQMEIGRT
jgi:UDP-glucose 4-epimerase